MIARIATAPGGRGALDALRAAIRTYLAGDPLDMSALAHDLGIGRATLYRWVGNREELLALVLAEACERTFREAEAGARGEGVDHVVDVVRLFMTTVAGSHPLAALTRREPLVFIRLVMSPGPLDERCTSLVSDLLAREAAAGRIELPLPPDVLGAAIVRLNDAYLYTYLLGRGTPEIDGALDLIRILLGAAPVRRD